MCIRWLINWSDSTKIHGATIRFIVHYQIQKIIPPISILRQMKPVDGPIPLLEDPFYSCPPIFQVGSSFQIYPPKSYTNLFSPPYVPRVPLISFFFILLPEYYLERSTDHKAPHYAIPSIRLLPRPSKAQNFFLVTLWCETSERFLHVGHSYNTISETVRNPINCKQKCASDGGRFNSKNKLATSLTPFVSHHRTAAHTVDTAHRAICCPLWDGSFFLCPVQGPLGGLQQHTPCVLVCMKYTVRI